ncbi:MAG: hypothetical protein ACO3Z2_08050, partial [Chitinophagaceae bacterium]
MPILGVCGDSYLAATQDLPHRIDCRGSGGKHFTELLAKKLGYDYYTMARGACSNTAIRLQIDDMINNKCDFVIIGTTWPSRLEYYLNEDKFNYSMGIYNINYSYHPDISSLNKKFDENASTISETIINVLDGSGPCKDEAQKESLKNYLVHIYHDSIKTLQDAWIIANGITELENAKIPFLILVQECLADTLVKKYQTNNPRILVEHDTTREFIPWRYDVYDEETQKNTIRRYHVSDKNQIKISNN